MDRILKIVMCCRRCYFYLFDTPVFGFLILVESSYLTLLIDFTRQ